VSAAGRRPKSVLHTLSVELSVLMGLDDRDRLDRLVAEATELLAREGREDAIRCCKRLRPGCETVRWPSVALTR
jgi:hypothetical protein